MQYHCLNIYFLSCLFVNYIEIILTNITSNDYPYHLIYSMSYFQSKFGYEDEFKDILTLFI